MNKTQKKWGNLYLGFMMMSGADMFLTKEKADEAMAYVDERYTNKKYQLNIDLLKFAVDLENDKSMKFKPRLSKKYKQEPTMSVGEKLLSIWQGSV